MRLLFAGTPSAAVPSLERLLAGPHDVIAVLTRPDALSGRGRSMHPSPVAVLAEAAGVEVLKVARPRDPAFLARLTDLAPDVCPIVAYGGLIPPEALRVPEFGWINLHFSLLPAWRGAAPVQHAIWHGDDVTGASTFLLEEGLDTGPVFGRVTERIGPHDTSGDLLQRLAVSGAELLAATLDGVADGTVQPVPQPTDGISYAPKIEPALGAVVFTEPAVGVDRRIRAFTPSPGAWATFRGERIKILRVFADLQAEPLAPGEIRASKKAVWAGTATTPVRLGMVQPGGKRPMPAVDWVRGLRLGAGEHFE